jgi:hypothetical protein
MKLGFLAFFGLAALALPRIAHWITSPPGNTSTR